MGGIWRQIHLSCLKRIGTKLLLYDPENGYHAYITIKVDTMTRNISSLSVEVPQIDSDKSARFLHVATSHWLDQI